MPDNCVRCHDHSRDWVKISLGPPAGLWRRRRTCRQHALCRLPRRQIATSPGRRPLTPRSSRIRPHVKPSSVTLTGSDLTLLDDVTYRSAAVSGRCIGPDGQRYLPHPTCPVECCDGRMGALSPEDWQESDWRRVRQLPCDRSRHGYRHIPRGFGVGCESRHGPGMRASDPENVNRLPPSTPRFAAPATAAALRRMAIPSRRRTSRAARWSIAFTFATDESSGVGRWQRKAESSAVRTADGQHHAAGARHELHHLSQCT